VYPGFIGVSDFIRDSSLVKEGGGAFVEAGRCSTKVSKPDHPSSQAEPLVVNTVLFYEDLSTGLRASQLLGNVARSLPMPVDFDSKAWRLDLLRESAKHEIALGEAVGANVLVLSAHGHPEPSAAAAHWMQLLIQRKFKNPCALVISLDKVAQNFAAAAHWIASLKRSVQPQPVTVFSQFGDPFPSVSPNPSDGGIPSSADISTESWNGGYGWRESHWHWGINE
jgi:hypothetical protein